MGCWVHIVDIMFLCAYGRGVMKQKLAKIFNYSAPILYGANECAQYLHMGYLKLKNQGIDAPYLSVYENMPWGGAFTRNYASGFFGAAASVFFFKKLSDYASSQFRKYATEGAVGASAVALTTYEATRGYRNTFDWGDMGIYAFALALSYMAYKIDDAARVDAGKVYTTPNQPCENHAMVAPPDHEI